MSAVALGESVGQAVLSPTFVVSSTKAAMILAAGQPLARGVVATNVLTLTQEAVKKMFLTKLKLGTTAVLCAGLFVAMIGSSFTSLGIAQDGRKKQAVRETADEAPGNPSTKTESDTDFIRRISKDLRGTDPTPTEIYFFVASKDTGRRQKLIDLFIQERQAKNKSAESADNIGHHRRTVLYAAFPCPSSEDILRRVPVRVRPKNARTQCELLKYQVDAPRYYPLVGPASLAHAHFKCTVFIDDRIEIVYLDRDHLIRTEMSGRRTKFLPRADKGGHRTEFIRTVEKAKGLTVKIKNK